MDTDRHRYRHEHKQTQRDTDTDRHGYKTDTDRHTDMYMGTDRHRQTWTCDIGYPSACCDYVFLLLVGE